MSKNENKDQKNTQDTAKVNAKVDEKQNEKVEPKKNEPETKESRMAKQIIDLETALNLMHKEISTRDEIIKKYKDEREDWASKYKILAEDIQNKANELISLKVNENEIKLKKEIEHAKKYAIKDQALELIDIIAEFEQAVNFKPQNPEIANWLVGFKMYLTKFHNLLNDLHISTIAPKVGEEFNPNTMSAFETVKNLSLKDNTVFEIIHVGYKLHDQLLEPAKVKVVKNH